MSVLQVHTIDNAAGEERLQIDMRMQQENAAPYYLSDASVFNRSDPRLIDNDGAFILYE